MDWSASPLGHPDTWPAELKTPLQSCCAPPMRCMSWGRGLITLYNDSYLAICGDRHPVAMGETLWRSWPEAWDSLHPLTEIALSGQAQRFEDRLVHLHGWRTDRRCGSASPGRRCALTWGLCGEQVCHASETTDKMLALRQAVREREGLTAADAALRELNADLETGHRQNQGARAHLADLLTCSR